MTDSVTPAGENAAVVGRWTSCIEAWPDCIDGDYNPACCRFPKSCSCDVWNFQNADPRYVAALPDPEPQPSDGPDYHEEHAAWERRQAPRSGSQPLQPLVDGCCCPRFSDTGGFRIADLGCPIHGVEGTDPGDGPWDPPVPGRGSE